MIDLLLNDPDTIAGRAGTHLRDWPALQVDLALVLEISGKRQWPLRVSPARVMPSRDKGKLQSSLGPGEQRHGKPVLLLPPQKLLG
jgi:hypothetical protein